MKKHKKRFLRKERGITLIALVITIIVLLILAGVSISMLTGSNGILTQAQNAKEETEKASLIEQAQTDLLGKQAENSSGNVTSEALKEVLDKYFSDVPGADEITVETEITAKEEYGNYKMKVSDIYDGEIKGSSIPAGLEIGSTVNYNPSGTYTWEANYYNSPSSTSYTDVTLDSSTSGSFNINTWKVLEIDREAEKVTLVPTSPTTGTVRLRGAQGYNNGVYLLNEACSKLYGNESKGITARSMNIEDIEKYMTKDALEDAYTYTNSSSNTQYGNQISSAYTTNRYYPSIYAKEKLSVIDGNKNETGIGMSEQEELIEPTDDGATSGYMRATTSIQPYQTYWYKDSSFMQTAFKDVENSSSASNYYNLIMPKGTSTTYWLASRCINTLSSDCSFHVRIVGSGFMNAYIMFYSDGSTYSFSGLALFPVVSLSSELIEGNAESGYTVE